MHCFQSLVKLLPPFVPDVVVLPVQALGASGFLDDDVRFAAAVLEGHAVLVLLLAVLRGVLLGGGCLRGGEGCVSSIVEI